MDPNIKTLTAAQGEAETVSEIDKDNERIERLYLEHMRRNKINKLEDFNKFVLHQFNELDKINKATVANLSQSISPMRSQPLLKIDR